MIQVWLCRGCVERTSGGWEWNVETQDPPKYPTCSGKWWWDKEDRKHIAQYHLYESLLCMRKVIGHAVNKPDHPTECRTVNQVNDTVCHGCHGDLPFENTREKAMECLSSIYLVHFSRDKASGGYPWFCKRCKNFNSAGARVSCVAMFNNELCQGKRDGDGLRYYVPTAFQILCSHCISCIRSDLSLFSHVIVLSRRNFPILMLNVDLYRTCALVYHLCS
jgi:hypothetical protein